MITREIYWSFTGPITLTLQCLYPSNLVILPQKLKHVTIVTGSPLDIQLVPDEAEWNANCF